MTDHPRPLDLEAYSVGEALPGLEAHLERCAACRDQIAAIERERQALLARLPPPRFIAGVAARRAAADRRARRLRAATAGGLGALAIAAVAAVLVLPSAPAAMRAKGIGVEIFVKRGDLVASLRADGRVRAGDGLRVSLTLPEAQRVSLWFVDAHGRVDPYPGGMRELPAGPNLLSGVTVDRPCVDMVLIIATRDARFERTLPCE
ncbi:MAG TPA: hypothetical protein VK607_15780 [Kofleriaceae bacterium]|nr:hypothetical protein [Kofleriaceae bacterium]